jgi:hypothetical protein
VVVLDQVATWTDETAYTCIVCTRNGKGAAASTPPSSRSRSKTKVADSEFNGGGGGGGGSNGGGGGSGDGDDGMDRALSALSAVAALAESDKTAGRTDWSADQWQRLPKKVRLALQPSYPPTISLAVR